MRLYELSQRMQDILAEIEENEGEMTDDILAKYEATKEQIDEKVDNYAAVIAEMKGEAESLDAEIKRLTARKKTLTNKVDHLKGNLLFNMQCLEMDKVKTVKFTASIRSAQSVQVDEAEMMESVAGEVAAFCEDHPYLEVKITPKKGDMTKAYKAGEELPAWASMTENASLQIR